MNPVDVGAASGYNGCMTQQKGLSRDRLVQLYKQERSISGVARVLKCSRKAVTNAMAQFDIEYDKVPRKYVMNDHFFDEAIESEEQFYWAGFLAASAGVTEMGSTGPTYRIEMNLALKDRDQLDAFMRSIGTDTPVKEKELFLHGGAYPIVKTVVNSKYLVQDLKRFNIGPRKRQNFHLPTWMLHHQLLRHFIRGYVDGVGNFYNSPNVYFRTSGTFKFRNQLSEILNRLKLQKKPNIEQNSYGRIEIHDRLDVNKVAHYLYDDCNFFMQRKLDAALHGACYESRDSDTI